LFRICLSLSFYYLGYSVMVMLRVVSYFQWADRLHVCLLLGQVSVLLYYVSEASVRRFLTSRLNKYILPVAVLMHKKRIGPAMAVPKMENRAVANDTMVEPEVGRRQLPYRDVWLWYSS
jgi:hypothetical protein